MTVAIGVDGAPAGWVAACAHADGSTSLVLAPDITALVALRGNAKVAIDIPIGLPETVGFRACDDAARSRLKGRLSSIFAPPARYLLEASGDYAAMRALVAQRRLTDPAAKSLSAQAAAIAPKIAEVDAFVRAHPDSETWLWECHPELSFAALNGGAIVPASKHTAAGLVQRLRLVRDAFADAEEQLAAAPAVPLVDALDAYAALTTAVRCANGTHETLGDGARDALRVPMRIAL